MFTSMNEKARRVFRRVSRQLIKYYNLQMLLPCPPSSQDEPSHFTSNLFKEDYRSNSNMDVDNTTVKWRERALPQYLPFLRCKDLQDPTYIKSWILNSI